MSACRGSSGRLIFQTFKLKNATADFSVPSHNLLTLENNSRCVGTPWKRSIALRKFAFSLQGERIKHVRLTTRALIKIAPRFVCSATQRAYIYSCTRSGTESCFTPSLQKVIPCSRDHACNNGSLAARWGRPLFRSLVLAAVDARSPTAAVGNFLMKKLQPMRERIKKKLNPDRDILKVCLPHLK